MQLGLRLQQHPGIAGGYSNFSVPPTPSLSLFWSAVDCQRQAKRCLQCRAGVALQRAVGERRSLFVHTL